MYEPNGIIHYSLSVGRDVGNGDSDADVLLIWSIRKADSVLPPLR